MDSGSGLGGLDFTQEIEEFGVVGDAGYEGHETYRDRATTLSDV